MTKYDYSAEYGVILFFEDSSARVFIYFYISIGIFIYLSIKLSPSFFMSEFDQVICDKKGILLNLPIAR